ETTDWESGKSTSDTFSASIAELAPSTAYHFRAVARNSMGVSYGGDETFTTIGLHYHLNVKNVDLPYEDKDETKELHVLLKNLSPTSKDAGADGEVVIDVKYEPAA
ncbi:unnamed protein product, partial [marine sediment metagenome]